MTTYRKVYFLKCGSSEKEFGSKKPNFSEVVTFTELNSPTNNDITLESKLVKVPTIPVSKPAVKPKRWLS